MDLIGILEHLFDKLKVDPTKHKVQNSPIVLFYCSIDPVSGPLALTGQLEQK